MTGATNGFQYMQMSNTSGNLLIGVEGSTTGNIATGDLAYSSVICTANTSALQFGVNQAVSMTLVNGGQVLINRTSAAAAEEVLGIKGNVNTTSMDLQVGTDTYYGIRFRNSSGGQAGYIQVNTSAVIYGTGSDYRLKDDFKDYNALELLSKIKTYDFAWKVDDTRNYGVIAHELQEVIPYVVSGKKDAINKDGSINPQGVDYSKIVPILVKAIQEQQIQIQELEARLKTLENK
jgi:hypothetical protein